MTTAQVRCERLYLLHEINPDADIRLFGLEVNDETYAICKSDMLIKGDDQDAENIMPDTSFSHDGHIGKRFAYMLTNAPYGKDWKKEKTFIEAEASRGMAGRFGAGLPRISDRQLLFTQHMLSKVESVDSGGSRICAVNNGSPLFTGDAGSGESEIRRWILENDWLEAIVSLPTQLFYNTGITTYLWVMTNRKAPNRKGKVLLINGGATKKVNSEEVEVFARKMKKSLGDKRNELGDEHIAELARLSGEFKETPYSKIFKTTDFAYRKITVERPLRLNFQTTPERIGRLIEETAFKKLKDTEQDAIRAMLKKMDGSRLWKDRAKFAEALDNAIDKAGLKLKAPVRTAILNALGQRDETAEICRDSDGKPEADSDLRDYENVPFEEDIRKYFDREVRPHIPDAWINEEVRDEKDGKVGKVGKVGYEISFNRYFYQYEPPRPLKDIEADTRECHILWADRALKARDVLAWLQQAIQEHGAPQYLRSDNGPEFIAQEVQRWLRDNQIQTIYIDPGSPWQNGFVESFHGRFRDECLNREQLWTLPSRRNFDKARCRRERACQSLHCP